MPMVFFSGFAFGAAIMVSTIYPSESFANANWQLCSRFMDIPAEEFIVIDADYVTCSH